MKRNRYFGIIGGMGSKATSEFFDRMIKNSKAEKDQEHMNLLILNHATLPDRTDIIINKRDNEFLDEIMKDFEIMKLAGVTDVAIPCNSAHFFYDIMQEKTEITIINMIEETVKEIHETFGPGKKVGLLATDGTVEAGIYKKYCDKYNLELIIPDRKAQKGVMDVIYNNIKGHLNFDATLLEELIEEFVFEEKCSCVIIGCTELSCVKIKDELQKYTYDAMDILVKRSIKIYDEYKKDKPSI